MKETGFIRTIIAAALALSLGPGCGAPELTLSADRLTISAGGIDFAQLTALVTNGDEPMGAGKKVTWDATGGSFSASVADTVYQEVSTDGEGKALLKLYSGKSQGKATVTASYYDEPSGLTPTDSISITFGAPSGKNNPVDGKLRLTCDAANIAALRTPTPNIKVTCTLTAQSRTGSVIPASALKAELMAEAGSIKATNDSYSGKKVYVYSPKGGNPTPKEVDRDSSLGEPGYKDGNGRSRNPRDGLVTIVAVVPGEEAFTDTNGNGKYDQGEPFIDAPEPFLDLDDNDTKDPNEKYIDSDGNGKWDKANGKWDGSTKIMALNKILWTGAVDSSNRTSRIKTSTGDTKIADGGQLELTAFLLDANMNPVAAFSANSDYIEWTLNSGNSDATSNDPTEETLRNKLGFKFDTTASNERKRWKIITNSFSPPTYKYTVEDYSKDTKTNPKAFSVSVKAYLTPGPQGEGYFVTQITDRIKDKLSGTCD